MHRSLNSSFYKELEIEIKSFEINTMNSKQEMDGTYISRWTHTLTISAGGKMMGLKRRKERVGWNRSVTGGG